MPKASKAAHADAEQESDLENAGLLTGQPSAVRAEGSEEEEDASSPQTGGRRRGSRSRRGARAMIIPVALAAGLLMFAYVGSSLTSSNNASRSAEPDGAVNLFGWGAFRGAINGVLDTAENSAYTLANYTADAHGQAVDQAAMWTAYYNQLKQQVQSLSPRMQAKLQGLREEMDAHKDELRSTVSELKAQMPDLSTEAFEERMELMKAQFPEMSYAQLKTKAKEDFQRRWKEQEEAYEAARAKREKTQSQKVSFSKLFGFKN
eukprot:TRINITY_DN4517_c0_g1_i4.p1 TRINITY_DN4517_c0_g1~~TRINITY_DN4517_c0_g1_i4.p1  ORF type:complete len:262 (-),score=77.34 TRINITY_DN4517_c0_g1_i4:116-901(-)